MLHQLAVHVLAAKYKIFWGCLFVAWLWRFILSQFMLPGFFPGFYGITLGNLGLLLAAWVLMRSSHRTQNSALAAVYAVAKR